MNRAFIARWTRMPHSTERLSASASSHHGLSSAAFITNIAESDFRHAHLGAELKFSESTRERLFRMAILNRHYPQHTLMFFEVSGETLQPLAKAKAASAADFSI